jgi:putative membrane protein
VTPSFLLWTRWQMPPDVIVVLLALLGLYLVGMRRWRPRGTEAVPVGRRIASFLGAIAALFVVLTGPVGDLAGSFLFSAHMVQHLVLTLVVPPLLLFAAPAWLLRPLLGSRVLALARVITRPVVAYAVSAAGMIVWHLPLLYNLAVAVPAVHAAMHVTLVGTAVLGWWPLMSPLPELPSLHYGLRLLYTGIQGLPMVVVAAFVTLADRVLYPHYAAAPRIWGLSPLDDQRLGGILMWVPAHVGLVVPFTLIFFRWARAEADPDEPTSTAFERHE